MTTKVWECNHDPLYTYLTCATCADIVKRERDEARFHLSEFTDRTIAAETTVGDLRVVLRDTQAFITNILCNDNPSIDTKAKLYIMNERIIGALEDGK